MRGNDAAGLLEVAEFERDGGANDLVLPIIRDRKAARPLQPVVDRPVTEFPATGLETTLKLFVDPKDEVQRAREHERRLPVDI